MITKVVDAVLAFGAALWQWRRAASYEQMLDQNASIAARRAVDCVDGARRAVDAVDDPRHKQMYDALVGLNGCGAFTHEAQIGRIIGDVQYRAAVTVYADITVGRWLQEVVWDAGYTIFADPRYRDRRWARGGGETVIRTDLGPDGYDEIAYFGEQPTALSMWLKYPVLRRRVARHMRGLWQITIYDPKWGDSELFGVLVAATRERQTELAALIAARNPRGLP